MGSDPSNSIVLPQGKAPKVAGSVWLEKGSLRLDALPGSGITHAGAPVTSLALESDTDGKQTVLNLGSLSFYVIKRGESFGVRVKDKENPDRLHFSGLDYYPADPKWRLEAKIQPDYRQSYSTQTPRHGRHDSPGALIFEGDGGENLSHRPRGEKGSKQLFLIFADETTGRETYGAGRYLYADPPDGEGAVVVDFNRAYNPPCAFTNYATCPLPPSQNRLALRIEAGEKTYAGSKH